MNDQMPPIVTEEPRRNNTPLIIAVVAIVLLCCCCLIGALGWTYGDCLTNPNDPAICPLATSLLNSL